MEHRKKLIHVTNIPIRWGDMDAMGHVNNTTYFRYFETVRIDWSRSIGCLPGPTGQGPVIVNAFCNFIRQFEYPGDVLCKHYTGAVGRSSFETYVTMERTDAPGRIDASGGAKVVWTDFPKQKSMPLPEGMRALLAP